MKKIYYYIKLENLSPIHVGSGDNTYTDLDVLRDKQGQIYIPGTSIAGSICHSLDQDEDRLKILPEFIIKDKKQTKQSPVYISDIVRDTENNVPLLIEKRDGIKLDEGKITIKNNKYDFEVVPAGNKFVWRIEICERQKEDSCLEKIIEKVLWKIDHLEICVGYKTTRGLGQLKITSIGKKVLDFSKEALPLEVLKKFNPYNPKQYDVYSWDKECTEAESLFRTLEVELKQEGGLSIRTYNTDKGNVDYEHMKSAGRYVIPGTSWNGLIRSCIQQYNIERNTNLDIKQIFGNVDIEKGDNNQVKTKAIKSKIYIEESVINNGTDFIYTRTRIDPFTSSAADGSLYKEKSCYNGSTKLTIRIDKVLGEKTVESIISLLKIFLNDLNYGFVALGGQTSIGRGLFKVDKIFLDGEKQKDWIVGIKDGK